MDIKWVLENYIESESECIFFLSVFEKKGTSTIDDLIGGLKALRLFSNKKEKESILPHLKILNDISSICINAKIAGEKLRDAIKAIEEAKNN